jgi:hypothetical protein
MSYQIPQCNSLTPKDIYKRLIHYRLRFLIPDADKPPRRRDGKESEPAPGATKNTGNFYPNPAPELTGSRGPNEQDCVEAEQWLDEAPALRLAMKDGQTNEVCWNDDAEEFIGSRWAAMMSDGKLTRSQLSTVLRMPGNTIHWMRATGRCRVHTRDLATFLKMYARQDGFAEKPFAERAKDTQQVIRQESQKTEPGCGLSDSV